MAKVAFTAPKVAGFKCPTDKAQAFIWDSGSPGLGLRATPAGRPAYVFQSVYAGRAIRATIGSTDAWSIPQARERAREMQRHIDEGRDPRELKAQAKAAAAAKKAAAAADAITARAAWDRYLAERRPHWGDRNHADHLELASPGGEQRQRGEGATKPGPLAELLALRLVDLTPATVEAWAAREAKARPARLRLALRLLKAFLRWAAAEPDLRGRVDPAAASAKKAREAAGKAAPKNDVLERGQLKAWFAAVREIDNPAVGAYLQCLLLTGARPGEMLALRWADIDAQWRAITIRDKAEGERTIPATPYVLNLLSELPRVNEWVFASTRVLSLDPTHVRRRARYHATRGNKPPAGEVAPASESGRLVELGAPHRAACAAAGLPPMSLHGLRRSFASLTEWLEIPAGVVAQLQGHKPSATAEKHYKRRPLDLLRVHAERIEAWILEQAGVQFAQEATA